MYVRYTDHNLQCCLLHASRFKQNCVATEIEQKILTTLPKAMDTTAA